MFQRKPRKILNLISYFQSYFMPRKNEDFNREVKLRFTESELEFDIFIVQLVGAFVILISRWTVPMAIHARNIPPRGRRGKRKSREWKERINCIGALLLDERADEFRSKMLLVIVPPWSAYEMDRGFDEFEVKYSNSDSVDGCPFR